MRATIARSRAAPPSTASPAWASAGASIRTWDARIGVPSVTCAVSSAARTAHRTSGTARTSASRSTWSRCCAPSSAVAAGGARRWPSAPRPIPYQPAEGRYRLTRGCIQALGAARTPFNIITRGPLIVRDVDVLAEAARRAEVLVSVSIATLDESLGRRLEPGVAPPRQRLRAIRTLTDAGIAAGVALAPVLPGLTDAPRATWRRCSRRPRGRRDPRVVERPEPASRNPRALPRRAGARVAGRAGPIPAPLPRRRVRLSGAPPSPARSSDASAAVRRGSRIGDRRRIVLAPPPDPSSCRWRSRSLTEAAGASRGTRAGPGQPPGRACRDRPRMRAAPSGRPRRRGAPARSSTR